MFLFSFHSFFFVDETGGEGIYYIPSDPVSSWKSDPETSGNTAYGVLQGVPSASNFAFQKVQEVPTTPNPLCGKIQKQTVEL